MQECLNTTAALNKTAADVMAGFDVHAATDVTGFWPGRPCPRNRKGVPGSPWKISTSDVPVMPEALEMYEKGVGTGAKRGQQGTHPGRDPL